MCIAWLFSQGGRPLCTQIVPGEGRPPSTILGVRKLETLGYPMIASFAARSNKLKHKMHKPFIEILGECRRPFAVSNAVCLCRVSFLRYLPLSLEAAEKRPKYTLCSRQWRFTCISQHIIFSLISEI